MGKKKFNRRQQAFILHYTGDAKWNGAEAARRAGYSERTARSIAHRLLTNVDILAEIDKRLDALALSSGEVLARLSDQATASMADFITVDKSTKRFKLDPEKAERLGKVHLIKKYVETDKGGIKIELYDVQAALQLLGRHHKLFTDRVEVDADILVKVDV